MPTLTLSITLTLPLTLILIGVKRKRGPGPTSRAFARAARRVASHRDVFSHFMNSVMGGSDDEPGDY